MPHDKQTDFSTPTTRAGDYNSERHSGIAGRSKLRSGILRFRLRLTFWLMHSRMIFRRWSSTLQEHHNYPLFEKYTSAVVAKIEVTKRCVTLLPNCGHNTHGCET